MLQPKDTASNSNNISNSNSNSCRNNNNNNNNNRTGRRRCSLGGKCIWPSSDWLRKLRNKQQQLAPPGDQQLQQLQLEWERERDTRRSSVLLMVLLSGSEMEAKAVVMTSSQQQQQQQQQQTTTTTTTTTSQTHHNGGNRRSHRCAVARLPHFGQRCGRGTSPARLQHSAKIDVAIVVIA
ncbi:hypothetical protein ACLKA6_013544 [Drosophila palustris]